MLLELLASTIQLGASINSSLGSESDISYREKGAIHLRVGDEFYGWGSLSKGANYVLGQRISSSYNLGVGGGYKYNISDRFNGFLEAGIGYPFHDNDKPIQQEVAYTYLVGRHNVYNRPIPVDVTHPYDKTSYESKWDIDYGAMMRAGVEFEVTDTWTLGLSYRYFNPSGEIHIWDEEKVAAGGGWWMETVNVNMNVVEFSVMYEF